MPSTVTSSAVSISCTQRTARARGHRVQALTAILLILVLQSFLACSTTRRLRSFWRRWRHHGALRAAPLATGSPASVSSVGYPLVPALYLFANAAIAGAMLCGRPKECAIAVAVAATAVPFYTLFARRTRVMP